MQGPTLRDERIEGVGDRGSVLKIGRPQPSTKEPPAGAPSRGCGDVNGLRMRTRVLLVAPEDHESGTPPWLLATRVARANGLSVGGDPIAGEVDR
jgi:hypothetical protein